ncbi:unnamed protein product [Penicillium palitans]
MVKITSSSLSAMSSPKAHAPQSRASQFEFPLLIGGPYHLFSLHLPVINRDNTRKTLYSCRGCTAMLTYPKDERISDSHMRLMRLDPELDKYERSFQIFRRAFRVWTEAELIENV